ncbi:glycoside hydrolase family 28 protein [Aquimarina algicola]|uniref:Glycoside hydrolase family 28 protein n=1 Tax=Aquimarina algicola TaxID=2589995 RepID=A0A504IYD3_9FLAO|nr:glycoside hydrolase family 28 protein [Aquimarina algicola]TPN81202.1 glycoside hydrolase family 28 protein [Aquimarina algicola]
MNINIIALPYKIRNNKIARYFLKVIAVTILISCNGNKPKHDFNETYAKAKIDTAWSDTLPKILEQIVPPTFKDTTYLISDTLNFRKTINTLIDQVSETGGGTISVTSGMYTVRGSIFMKSNVNLHFSEGAILNFSPNPEDYLPVVKTRWEGTFIKNYSPLIYAIGQENLAITGKGVIDGHCEKIWASWKQKQNPDKIRARQMGNDKVPLEKRVFGKGHFLRPAGIQFIECKNILLEDFTIKSTPFWTINPILSENITVSNLTILQGTTNDDGVDPESSKNVLIKDCIINTHDDCIAIKAGRDQDGWPYPPSENIIIRNNELTNVVGSGFCIGSEMSAGVRNVFFENNTLKGGDKHAFQFKSNPDRGGFIKEIYIRNVEVVTPVKYGFEFTTDYKGWRGNTFFTQYSDFYFQNIKMVEAQEVAIKITGRREEPIKKIYLENVAFGKSPNPFETEYLEDVILNNVKVKDVPISKQQ